MNTDGTERGGGQPALGRSVEWPRDRRGMDRGGDRRLEALSPFDGILLVDKPSGPTSHDIVDRIRRKLGLRKVGHGGTLDPISTGLLVILVGRATKLAQKFTGSDKTYQGTMRLGATTDSHDAQGKVLREGDWSKVGRAELEAAMARFKGDIMQTPPMVSARKVGGVPLYKRARRGEIVEREPKLVHIYDFRILDFQPPSADFVVKCTKGTYVRTLCSDIGDALGCGAYLSRLRRLQSGDMKVEDAASLEELLAMDRDAVIGRIIRVNELPQ